MQRTNTSQPNGQRHLGRMWRLATIGVIFALAVALVGQTDAPVASAQTPEPAFEKLDGYLSLLAAAPLVPAELLPGTRLSNDERTKFTLLDDELVIDGDGRAAIVEVLIDTTASDVQLEAVGVTVLARVSNIVAARVSIDDLGALSRFSAINRIEASLRLESTNDFAAVETGASLARSPLPGYDGTGVVVGIIDSGIDIFHQDFRNADGTTRVKAILDLTLPGSDIGGGTAFNEAQINSEILFPNTAVPHRDVNGHGSHVAGSAAGDGSATSELGQFAGIAPRADLVVVKSFNPTSSATLLAALSFIDTEAAALGKPWVTNMSFGTNLGPHDGTSLLDQAVDSVTGAANPGQVVVVAAGNEGNDLNHAGANLILPSPGGTFPLFIEFSIPPGESEVLVDIWYDGDSTFQFGWLSPSGTGVLFSSNPYPLGSTTRNCGAETGGFSCITVAHFPDAASADNFMVMSITGVDADLNPIDLVPGTWTLFVEAVTIGGDARLDAYVSEQCSDCEFVSPIASSRLRSPGTANNAITVGSYVTFSSTELVGSVSGFSSPGPTRDLRQKPELIAPGQEIFSSRSSASPGSGTYTTRSGTSMAAPMVAGAVALLLQADPTLTSDEIRDLLVATAREDNFTGTPGWDDDSGWGKLNVYAALATLLKTDAVDSSISADTSSVSADGSSSTTVTVTLVDDAGNPVLGHLVQVGELGTAIANVTPSLVLTDASGAATFSASSTEPGLAAFRALDVTDGVLLTETALVTFTSGDSNDATLSALALSEGTLAPAFDADTMAYTASVPNATDALNVTATVNDNAATLEVNGSPVASGVAESVPLAVGPNSIEVAVTAEDASVLTYNIEVTRGAPPAADDATLAALALSAGSLNPTFAAGTTAYTANVANGVTSIDVTATTNDGDATLEIEGGSAISGVAESVVLAVGTNSIDIVVTAEDGTTELTYTVTVTRAALATDADLVALSVSPGVLTPGFSAGTLAYTASVANAVTAVDVTASTSDPNANLEIEGSPASNGVAETIGLAVGANIIDVVVTAEDGVTAQAYTIIVTRDAPPPPGEDATLSALSISPGVLTPGFSAGTLAYTASVANAVTSVDVTASTNDGGATLEIEGSPASNGVAETIGLTVGANVIDVVVTADDGTTTETYTVTVTRAAPPAVDDATLSALSLSSGALSPVFAPATTGYTANVANGISSVVVSATPASSAATFTVNGDTDTSVPLVVGPNVIEVVVTAEDGVATETYTVTVTRAVPPPPPPAGGGGGGGGSVLTITPTLEVTNDDGGSATVDDFTVLLNGEAIEFDEATTGSSGLNRLTMGGPVSLYAFTFSGDCDANGFFSLSLGDEFDCDIEADDLPLAQVLGAPLPGAETLIDESLSFALDSFLLERVAVVQASTAESTPLLTVTVPLAAVPGQSSVTVSVIEGNADAARFNPVGGTVFVGGTAYDIQILDDSGNPIGTFPTPIELSFLLPDGLDGDTVAAYFWDEGASAWIGETGKVVNGRFVVTTSHLTTFALFAFGDVGGGFNTALPSSGIALTLSEGGTITQLRRALVAAGAEAVFVTQNGRFISYFPDAPDFVNAAFLELFGGSVPAGRPMIVSLGG